MQFGAFAIAQVGEKKADDGAGNHQEQQPCRKPAQYGKVYGKSKNA